MTRPLLIIGNKNYSSWSLRAWLTLRKAGVTFEERRLPLDTPTFEAEIGDLSPSRRVPALWDGDLCVWDSLAIGEYVNERWAGGSLLPADLPRRALARSLCAEMHAGFPALRSAMPMNCRATGRRVPMSAPLETDIRRIVQLWSEARAEYGKVGPWLLGHFSLADAMFAPVAFRFQTYGVNVPDVVRGYMHTVFGDEDIRAWVDAALEETEIVEADEAGL